MFFNFNKSSIDLFTGGEEQVLPGEPERWPLSERAAGLLPQGAHPGGPARGGDTAGHPAHGAWDPGSGVHTFS